VVGATAAVARLAVLPAIAASPGSCLVAAGTRAVAGLTRPKADDPELATLLPPAVLGQARLTAHYAEVVEDPEVEAVYVPLPNGLHAEWTERAAAAGKHILCEKPLSPHPDEARAMKDACERAGVVLAEAYMTPFHPVSQSVKALVASGTLGQLRFAHSAFTFPLNDSANHRWDAVMGGGALADVGVYCLAPLLEAAGRRPIALAAAARVTKGGVDASLSGWLDFGEGFSGTIECSLEAPERQELELVGTEGALTVKRPFTPGRAETGFDIWHADGRVEHVEAGGGDPYLGMVEAFADAARGKTTPARTVDETVDLLEVADDLRRAAGVRLAPLPTFGSVSAP
jgi:predicted dehydrogenase